MKFDLAECKFIICKKWILFRVAGQLIYDSPARQNCNLFHGNAGILRPPSRVPVMADQDLTRSLSEAVSRAVSETVSAVLARVSI